MFLLVFIILTGLFGFVIIYGAPYLPTKRAQVLAALDLLELKPGQTLYELGSGDGRVAKQAAERGLKVVGYELNPLLVIFSRLYTLKYRRQIRIIWGSFWRADISRADGIFVFLHTRFMSKLDKKISTGAVKPVKLASYAYKISGKKSIKNRAGVFLYQY